MDTINSAKDSLRLSSCYAREFLAEFLGTFVLIVLGDGAVAQMALSQDPGATYLSVNFGFSMAVAFGVYVSGGVTGGHINPAVTLVMAAFGESLVESFVVNVIVFVIVVVVENRRSFPFFLTQVGLS